MSASTSAIRAAVIILGLSAAVATVLLFTHADTETAVLVYLPPATIETDPKAGDFRKFTSVPELRDFLSSYGYHDYLFGRGFAYGFSSGLLTDEVFTEGVRIGAPPNSQSLDDAVMFESVPHAAESRSADPDYSTTNIQVKNVDEPDFIKNDGQYIYVLAGSDLVIIRAHPAEDAEVTFESDMDPNDRYVDMFLNRDRLAVMYEDYVYKSVPIDGDEKRTWSTKHVVTNVLVFDVGDRSNAIVVGHYSVDGAYHDARMIGNHAYIITKNHLNENPVIPQVRDIGEASHGRILLDTDVYYFDGTERPSVMTTVSAIDVTGSGDGVHAQTYLLGDSDVIYVSEDNLYLTIGAGQPSPEIIFEKLRLSGVVDVFARHFPDDGKRIRDIATEDLDVQEKLSGIFEIIRQKHDGMTADIEQSMWDFYADLQSGPAHTIVHKIALGGESFDYEASTEVPGLVLNQFSMDEHEGLFRIATTVQQGRSVHNNVHVLGPDLRLVGSLEGIAPDESIYSARFAGDKLYLVTFRQIDPFFVIDLSGGVPRILGELKIPGFSNYLHPYGQDTVIGIGRDGGVKVAMFDISDFDDPRLKDEVIIGDARTESLALYDHKAVLIDAKKQLISLPIYDSYPDLHKIQGELSGQWAGFHVYGIGDGGFEDLGTVRHGDDYPSRARSLYIHEALYTIMDDTLKINDLGDIDRQIKTIVFG